MNLTLPSNSSEKYYPNNTLTEYRTHLVQPLNFEDSHEVALTEIAVPTQWSCLPENEYFMIVALRSVYSLLEVDLFQEWKKKKNKKDNTPTPPPPPPPTDVDWTTVNLPLNAYREDEYDGGRSPDNTDLQSIRATDSNYWRFLKKQDLLEKTKAYDKIHKVEYFSMLESVTKPADQKMLMWNSFKIDHPLTFKNNNGLVDYLNTLYEEEVEKGNCFLSKKYLNKSTKKIFTIQKGSDMVSITPPRHCAIKLTPALAYLLGFPDQTGFYWPTKSPTTMDVFGDSLSIYVYCDLIETRAVADKMAQLLRVVAIDRSGRKGVIQTVSFPQLQFFPMRSNSVNTVGIYLRDRAGRKIPFLRGEVTVSLLLRPKDL